MRYWVLFVLCALIGNGFLPEMESWREFVCCWLIMFSGIFLASAPTVSTLMEKEGRKALLKLGILFGVLILLVTIF